MKIQRLDSSKVNFTMKELLLNLAALYTTNAAFLELLEYWGEPQEMISPKQKTRRLKTISYESDDDNRISNVGGKGYSDMIKNTSLKRLKPQNFRSSVHLEPLQQLDSLPKPSANISVYNLRAQNELEAIKKFKRDQLDQEQKKHQMELKRRSLSE